jgi:hypothetical protein
MKQLRVVMSAAGAAALVCAGLTAFDARAQTASQTAIMGGGSSQQGGGGGMWGVSGGSGVGGSADSATMHQLLGQTAGQVESARKGFLYAPGSSVTVQAIGSQSIVNNSVYGNNNSASIVADQYSTSAGQVTNSGVVSVQNATN